MQTHFSYYMPTRIIFGLSFEEVLAKEVTQFGKKALLITGKNFVFKTGILEKTISLLKKSSIQTILFTNVTHDPSFETIREAVELARSKKIDFVIAIGGGSVIDVAKLVAGAYTNKSVSLSSHTENGTIQSCLWKGKEKSLDLIAIPTTAGSGSEVSKAAVITDAKYKIKCSIKSPYFYPALAIVDPSLTNTLSHDLTAHTGMDALTHLVESYLSVGASDITDRLALRGIELIMEYLPKVIKNPQDATNRKYMMLASLYGGIADTNAGLGVDHVAAHIIGTRYDVPHGLACGILLPHAVAHNAVSQKQKMITLSKICKKDAVKALQSLIKKLSIPSTLRSVGIPKSDLPKIAEKAFTNKAALAFNPRQLSVSDIELILENAY